MLPRQITHQNIFRVLIAGFALVILLLLAAAIVGVRNIQSIQESAASLVREQAVTNRLIDELHSQQTSLSEVFSVLARDPDSVDYDRILSQLDEADRDIDRISAEGAHTPEQRPVGAAEAVVRWISRTRRAACSPPRIRRRSPRSTCSAARRVHLGGGAADRSRVPQSERGPGADRPARPSRLLRSLAALRRARSVLLALVFAVVTVRHGRRSLIRGMEWQTGRTGPRLLAHAGGPGGHGAALLPRAARRTGPVADRRQDQPHGARIAARPGPRARWTIACAWWTKPSATCARCRSCCAPPSWTISDWRPGCAGWREGFAARTGIEVDFDSDLFRAGCPTRPRRTCSASRRRR